MIKNIYKEFKFTTKYKKDLLTFLKNQTTVESGGNKIFDGTFNHLDTRILCLYSRLDECASLTVWTHSFCIFYFLLMPDFLPRYY